MTNNIHGIGINTGAVNPYLNPKTKSETKPEENGGTQTGQPQGGTVAPDDVLGFMAQQGVYNKPVSPLEKYNIAKYVTPEQAARIAGFITSFEGEVANGLLTINEEFGDTLSENVKIALAAELAGPKSVN